LLFWDERKETMRVLEFFFGGGKWYNEGLQMEEEHGVEDTILQENVSDNKQWSAVTNGTREEESYVMV